MDKVYDKMIFKLLDIMQRNILITEGQKTNRGSPTIVSVCCLKMFPVFRQWPRQGVPRQNFLISLD